MSTPRAPNVIKNAALDIRGMAPTLNTGHVLSPNLRRHCEEIAFHAGLSPDVAARANDNDLISVYLVALKDGAAAIKVAQKIAFRLDDTLLGPAAPYPAPQPPPATPNPRRPSAKDQFDPLVTVEPQAPATLPGYTEADIRRIAGDVLKGVLPPMQTALDGMDKDLRDFTRETARATLDAATDAMRDQIKDAVAEALRSVTPMRLDVVLPDQAPIALGLVHKATPQIIAALSCGVNVYLHGPAGSGKTTVAQKCAEAFNLKFYFAAKVESEYQLIGFVNAVGATVRTQFREAYEHGGVFLFDEMDASSPSAVVALNAALANGVCPFPDAIVSRHPDFKVIGAGNTTLTGANRQYAGRNQLDAASIDRFAFIEFPYDDDLERALAPDGVWCAYVQRVRAVVKERGLNHLVTPRATYDGCKLLAQGMDRDTVASMVVFKGLDADTVTQIKRAI